MEASALLAFKKLKPKETPCSTQNTVRSTCVCVGVCVCVCICVRVLFVCVCFRRVAERLSHINSYKLASGTGLLCLMCWPVMAANQIPTGNRNRVLQILPVDGLLSLILLSHSHSLCLYFSISLTLLISLIYFLAS